MSYYSSTTLFKNAPDGLIAHVYEHVVSSYLTTFALKNNLYILTDYTLWARTYGAIMYVEVETYTDSAEQLLRTALEQFGTMIITAESIHKAAQQIAIELERPLVECSEDFIVTIRALHSVSWRELSELEAEQADPATSVNTLFSSNGYAYGNESQKSFLERTLHIEVDVSAYQDSPAKKALAVLVVQMVTLNIHALLEADAVFYDRGDEWDANGETVMYRTTLGFEASTVPSTEWASAKIAEYLDLLKSKDLTSKFVRLLGETYSNDYTHYFTLSDINQITDGIIIGNAGWRSVAESEIVSTILGHVVGGDAEQF